VSVLLFWAKSSKSKIAEKLYLKRFQRFNAINRTNGTFIEMGALSLPL
jgi:hypothetical protein